VPDLVLQVNGRNYAGWKEARVKRSVRAASGIFSLVMSDRFADLNQLKRLGPDDECLLLYGDEVMINGYVDDAAPRFDAQGRGMSISGRDLTRNIVDCSAIVPSQTLIDLKLDEACRQLCAPYGVEVVALADVGEAFAEIAIDTGETVFEVIEARVRQRGLLLNADALGRLVLSTPSKTRLPVALVEGQNLKLGSALKSSKQRFGKYSVYSQAPSTDNVFGDAAQSLIGVAKDSGADSRRHKIIVSEKVASAQDCVTRARWERNMAIAQSLRVSGATHDWGFEHNGSFKIWRENRQVKVESAGLDVNETMFIESIEYSLDEDSGKQCAMDLVRPWVFTAQPEVEEVEGSLSWT